MTLAEDRALEDALPPYPPLPKDYSSLHEPEFSFTELRAYAVASVKADRVCRMTLSDKDIDEAYMRVMNQDLRERDRRAVYAVVREALVALFC